MLNIGRKQKKILICLFFYIFGVYLCLANNKTYNIYYFHTKEKSGNCLKIEKYVKDILIDNFKKKTIFFKSIDIDDKKNKQIVERFRVFNKSLLITKEDSKKYKYFDRIWLNLSDEENFKSYLFKEIKNFVK